ncbi:hypothetical protein ACWGE0_35350 [Lentzea sp. NPDC054927]
MAVVSMEVAERLRSGTFAELAVFTASCAERMAQLFTGLRGDDTERAADIATFLTILDELWDADLPATGFLSRVRELEGFDELDRTADEEPLSEIDDIYSFNSVLCTRYAALYRATQDPGEVVRCAHVSLSALWQLDRNISQPGHFESEHEYQQRVVLGDFTSLSEMRAIDRLVARERLLVVRSRL